MNSRKIDLIILLCMAILLVSCNYEPKVVKINESVDTTPEWTFLIYMAADNDLYKSAEMDVNELLSSKFSEKNMQILLFCDSSNPIKIQDTEYSGANLFCVKNARNGTNYLSQIQLEQIGFTKENTQNVDSGDIHTLEKLLDYTKKDFSANNFALFLWGHGTGYKYSNQLTVEQVHSSTKGVCQDSKSGSYISTVELASALKNKDFSLVGFDACFSGLLEVAYELKNCVKTIVGSEGALNVTGWNYENIFTQFSKSDLSIQSLKTTLLEQYASQYSTDDFMILDTSKIEAITNNFNDFTKAVGNYINSVQKQKQVFDLIYSNVKSYVAPTFPTEMFIDVYDFAENFCTATLSAEITETSQKLINTLTTDDSPKINLAIYFMTLESPTIKTAYFDSIYVNDNKTTSKLDFAINCDGWVSTRNYQIVYNNSSNDSLLDKLFFTIF